MPPFLLYFTQHQTIHLYQRFHSIKGLPPPITHLGQTIRYRHPVVYLASNTQAVSTILVKEVRLDHPHQLHQQGPTRSWVELLSGKGCFCPHHHQPMPAAIFPSTPHWLGATNHWGPSFNVLMSWADSSNGPLSWAPSTSCMKPEG